MFKLEVMTNNVAERLRESCAVMPLKCLVERFQQLPS